MIEALLGDDFTFTSPLDAHIDRAAYFKRCWPNSETIRSIQIEKLADSGPEAFIRYELETTAGGKFRNTEWFRFEGAKLMEVQVFFGEQTRAANSEKTGEAEIRSLIEDSVSALRDKDIDRLVAGYAPDVMLFDVVTPLRSRGADAVRKRLEDWLTFQDPIEYELQDLSISTAGDVAFSHSLNHVSATTKDGKKLDMWWRASVGYRKLDGKWLITLEHVSVPFDVTSGKASLDLKPE